MTSALGLRSIALLQGLDTPALEALAQQCRWQCVKAGQTLITRDARHGEVFFLVSGRVQVTTYSADGRQVSFRDIAAGDHFGDFAAFDNQPRCADVVSTAPCVIAALPAANFLELLRLQPAVAERVIVRLVDTVRQLSERVIEISSLDARGRLVAELLRRARTAGVQNNRAQLDPAPHHELLASYVNTRREQVSRTLADLVREGLVAKEQGSLLIPDVARLAQLV